MSVIRFRPAVKRVSIIARESAQHPARFEPEASAPPSGARLDALLDEAREQLAALVDEARVDTQREADALRLVALALDCLLVERLGGAEADSLPGLLDEARDIIARLRPRSARNGGEA
jgi:hypothetical protein